MYAPSNLDVPRVVDRSGQVGAPNGQPGMVPTVALIPGLRTYSIVYCDDSELGPPVGTPHHLHSLWSEFDGEPHWTDLTQSANRKVSNKEGIKNPFSYVDTTRNVEIVLWNSNFYPVGGDDETGAPRGDVWGHFYSRSESRVDAENLTRAAGVEHQASAGSDTQAVGFYIPAADTHSVIFQRFWENYEPHELYWTGTSRVQSGVDLSEGPSLALGSAFVGGQGLNYVLYIDLYGTIVGMYWRGDEWPRLEFLNVMAGTPRAQVYQARPRYNPDPVGYYTAHNDTYQVVYRGFNDHLYRLFWSGPDPVQYWDLTERAIAPLARYSVCNFSAYYKPGSNTHHVIYVTGNDLHLHEISWVDDGADRPRHEDLTARLNAPLARGRPASFVTEWNNARHVAYRGNDNHIYELVY
jgi:hypothetical protein